MVEQFELDFMGFSESSQETQESPCTNRIAEKRR